MSVRARWQVCSVPFRSVPCIPWGHILDIARRQVNAPRARPFRTGGMRNAASCCSLHSLANFHTQTSLTPTHRHTDMKLAQQHQQQPRSSHMSNRATTRRCSQLHVPNEFAQCADFVPLVSRLFARSTFIALSARMLLHFSHIICGGAGACTTCVSQRFFGEIFEHTYIMCVCAFFSSPSWPPAGRAAVKG